MSHTSHQPYYDVVIRRVLDGLERTYHERLPWTGGEDEPDLFWWSDGNAACDCSRGRYFDAAGGEIMGEYSCGSSAYVVVRFEFPDGTTFDPKEVTT